MFSGTLIHLHAIWFLLAPFCNCCFFRYTSMPYQAWPSSRRSYSSGSLPKQIKRTNHFIIFLHLFLGQCFAIFVCYTKSPKVSTFSYTQYIICWVVGAEFNMPGKWHAMQDLVHLFWHVFHVFCYFNVTDMLGIMLLLIKL